MNDEDGCQAATPATEGRRYALRRRRSYPKDDDDGSCKSTMAATADEALFEPSTKTLKPDSPGEARNLALLDSTTLESTSASSSKIPSTNLDIKISYFDLLSEEIILEIFLKMFEKDLYNLSLVNKRFHRLANDTKLWKRLYEETFEYAIPLQRLQPCRFDFRPPQRWRSYLNPWFESFRQLVS
uniref:F-box domain-containing protein n=1 Tax=Panagrolaimus davidi TaxID=227884 RepID=A0A914PKL9_9BILA